MIERGESYFFSRNRIGVERAADLDDIQHLHMILVPDGAREARLLVVGRKRLPEIPEEGSRPGSRGWLMVLATGTPVELASRLGPLEYETATRGARREGEAIPAAAGRYAIRLLDEDSFLHYRIHEPRRLGPAQHALGLHPQATYVVAVRNPEVHVEGFPEESPDYPKDLEERFADLRWIEVSTAELLDHENVQLVLLGGREGVPGRVDLGGALDLFATFDLDRARWPIDTLEKGRFSAVRFEPPASSPVGDRSKGVRRGGRAAREPASAAGIARALAGIELPAERDDLIEQARHNAAAGEVLGVLARLPARTYRSLPEVEQAFSELH